MLHVSNSFQQHELEPSGDSMKLKKIAALIAIAGLSTSAFATNGYFSHGFGIKAKGMGGVGIALPQDGLAAATNPAGMVMVGNRTDFGVDWFRPIRSTEITGLGKFDGSDTKNFLIPEFGYNRMINPNLSLGVSVYGNGGMNTDYGDGIPALFGPFGKLGVNLMQLFIAPTVAYKLAPNHAVGVSLNLAYQRISIDGLQGFALTPGASVSPGNVTNRDNDTSKGIGFRIGYTGKLSDMVTVGATYQSKTSMSKFSKYKGLFAEGGDFDIPENYGFGIAVKATPALTVALDVVEIKYSDIKSIANTGNVMAQLGANNGPGFGWDDMTVYKLGVSYELSQNLTLRAGYNHGKQPIPSSETFFNILAPGVVENHLTLGATWTLANKDEISVS
jgi:long-chain fatty acid transport protein